MHKMGLHGKSFIPMLMGFGCNVPAIMATRAIESRSSRLITILITPFMSCSARLPVLVLFAGAFFPGHAATVLIGLYLLGIAVAIITARLLRLTRFKKDETPFVMELPPYRWPTLQATLRHMWDKCALYLKKIGTVILLSTIAIWFLSYFPRPDAAETAPQEAATELYATWHGEQTHEAPAPAETTPTGIHEGSFMGMLGRFIEPVMAPLGLNWRASTAIITSIPAKELVVSTLGVLYSSNSEEGIAGDIKASGDYTPRSALAFMVFILLFFPCIATVAAIAEETKSRWWALFSIVYNTAVAWALAFAAYALAGIL
jgi:ferrous iron transport protein B